MSEQKKKVPRLEHRIKVNKPNLIKSAPPVDKDQPIQYLTRNEYIKERFNLEILDAYDNLSNQVRNGPYGYVFSELSQKRSADFVDLIHRNINYGFYKHRGEYFDRHQEEYDSNSSDEPSFWGEKQNKFAYT